MPNANTKFHCGNKDAFMKAAAKIIESIKKEFEDVFFQTVGDLKAHFHYR